MKKSLLLLVVAAVVCLLVFADYARKPALETGKRSVTGRVMQIQAFKGISPDTVSKIEILTPRVKEPVVLEKDAGEWKVKSRDRLFRISKYKAEQLFGKQDNKPELKGPLTLDLQARNPKSHADFSLTREKATDVKFYDAKNALLTDVLIGKAGTDWQTTFIRFPGKDEVYLAPIRLTDNFSGADVNAWRDRRLFPDLKSEYVYKIHVDDRANTRTYALVKRPGPKGVPGKWYVTEPYEAPARATTADSMARTVTGLTAADFVTSRDLSKTGFDHPTMIARFDIKDDPTTPVLTIGAESANSKGQFYAKTNLSDEVYLIYKPYALNVSPDSLKETPTPTPSPSPTVSPTPPAAPSAASATPGAEKTGGTTSSVVPAPKTEPAPMTAAAPTPVEAKTPAKAPSHPAATK